MLIKTRFEKATDEKEWINWLSSLLELYSTEKQFVTNEIYKTSHLQMSKWIMGHKFTNKELILRNLILDAMLSADAKAPGAGSYVPWFLFKEAELYPERKPSINYLKSTCDLSYNEEVKEIFKSILLKKIKIKKVN